MMSRGMAGLFLLCFVGRVLTGAQNPVPECYRYDGRNEVQSAPHAPEETLSQVWCYERLQRNGAPWIFAYNVDDGAARLELSALVELDSEGKIDTVIHGTLFRGERRVHRYRDSWFRPFSVPLTLYGANQEGTSVRYEVAERGTRARRAVLNALEQGREKRATSRFKKVQAGTFSAYVTSEQVPFAGHWWPWNGGELFAPKFSPLAKYDRIVQHWTGQNPGAVAWERTHHGENDVFWSGHCNGWAAASVLYSDWAHFLWHAPTETLLMPSDIRGLRTEMSYCVDYAFYGTRYYDSNSKLEDIDPDLFHQVLVYYLDQLEKPVAIDSDPRVAVWNRVVSGYEFQIKESQNEANAYNVTARVVIRRGGSSRRESTVKASSYIETYRYVLYTNDQNEIVDGVWLSGNPDFLWVPLATKKCAGENPNLDPAMVDRFLTDLTETKMMTKSVDWSLNRELEPNETVTLLENVTGYRPKLHLGEIETGPKVDLVVDYVRRHGSDANENGQFRARAADYSNRVLTLQAQKILSVRLENQSALPSFTSFVLKEMTYLGADEN